MSRDKNILSRRVWLRRLNGYGDHTAVFTQVHVYANRGGFNAHFALRDCGAQVGLDCYASEMKHAKAHVKAVNKLLDELTLFRDKMEQAIQECEDADWDREGKRQRALPVQLPDSEREL